MLDKIKPLTFGQLFITHECQLKCKYCYETFNNNEVMSLETAYKIIDFIFNNAKEADEIPQIAFFGGEPLLHFEDIIIPCVNYIKSKENGDRCIITFSTNGVLMTEDILKFIKKNKIKFMLSMDGSKNSQDSTRCYKNKKSCFSAIDKNIELMPKYCPDVLARITSDPDNVKYLYESLLYFEEKGFQKINVIPNVLDKWSDENIDTLKEQLDLIKKHYIEMFEDYEVPVIPETFSQMFYRRVIKEYCEEHNLYRVGFISDPLNRCGFCFNGKARFDIDGSLYTCDHMNFKPTDDNIFYLGNINDSEFKYEKIEELYKMNIASQLHSEFDCKSCPLDRICSGGCVPNNYLVTGDFNNVSPSYCKWYSTVYNAMSELVDYFNEKQDNPLFKDYFYGAVIGRGGCDGCTI